MCKLIDEVTATVSLLEIQTNLVSALMNGGALNLISVEDKLQAIAMVDIDEDRHPLRTMNPNEVLSSIVQSALIDATVDIDQYMTIRDKLSAVDRLFTLYHNIDNPYYDEELNFEMNAKIAYTFLSPHHLETIY